MSGGIFQPIVDILTKNDRYFHCADYASYLEAQERAADTWTRTEEWTRMSILNTARSGYFSADRTIREYAQEIWGV
jgi:starch phosphorylase